MQRIPILPRPDWQAKIKELGFVFYNTYYSENAAYAFTEPEILAIEQATNEIQEMCLHVVQHVIDNNLWDEFFIPRQYANLIRWSWEEDMPSFYGRLDLAFNNGSIKLLEYNADTPTSLLEASVIQWYWLKDYEQSGGKTLDQFNAIHERLVEHLKVCKPYLPGTLYFAAVKDSTEDFMNVKYLEDCAHQAGIPTAYLNVEDISLDPDYQFVTPDGKPIQSIFKLYPYEWMFNEEFGMHLPGTREKTIWVEPAWKAILSNKMLLVYLHKLFPHSPYILPAFFNEAPAGDYVKKPVYSREGANVTIVKNGLTVESTEGDYGEEGFVYQQYTALPDFDGHKPVIGSWLIGGQAAGMGIREDLGLVTKNTSRFVPHYFK